MRPSSLYRSNSQRQTPIVEANANNINEDVINSVDCGITVSKCCNTPGCQKLANKKTFTIVLVLSALIQGAIESYFRISAKQAALTHDFEPMIVDWLLVSSGILQGLFALIVTYWGNRLHRTAWLGGLFMLQSVACIIVVVPTLVNSTDDSNTLESIESTILCIRNVVGNLMQNDMHSLTTLILLFVVQLGIAFGMIAFYTLGFSYLDDIVDEHESPALLAAPLAAKFFGLQMGPLLSMIIEYISLGWFLGWIFLAPILFTIGFIAMMFPRKLLSNIVKQATNDILESSTNASHASLASTKFIADIGYFATIFRLFTNKILILNIFAAVFVQTAFINFSRHEANYLQSRFFLPTSEADGFGNEYTSILITALLKPPMIALTILVAGLIIAKANPRPRKLVIWNIAACAIVAGFFVASIYIDCENSPIAGAHRRKINQPYCAHSCRCDKNVQFTPVCPERGNRTYYSPCHAGCGDEILINGIRMFGNCSCGIDTEFPMVDLLATEGACGMEDCQPFWISYLVMSVVVASLLGSTLIGKLIISLRAVLPQDKSSAIAFELFFVGIVVYVPGKLFYRLIADKNCQYVAPDQFRCFLHESPAFGDYLNWMTAGLIGVGIIFEILLLFVIGDLPLYGDEGEDEYRPIEISTLTRYQDAGYRPELDPLMNQNEAPPPERPEPVRVLPPIPIEPVTYAQIVRQPPPPVPSTQGPDHLDFRLQNPPTPGSPNNSLPVTSGRSSISSGYLDLTQNIKQNQVRPTFIKKRPMSPETSF